MSPNDPMATYDFTWLWRELKIEQSRNDWPDGHFAQLRFQVDLFYDPYALANLNEGFDPDANARMAAYREPRTAGQLRMGGAIAAYHSAVPLIDAVYLQKVPGV